jgi:hypothetical protein
VALKLEILQTFLGWEVWLPYPSTANIDEFGFDHSTHLGGSSFRLHFENLVSLSLDTDDHSFAQLRCDNHDWVTSIQASMSLNSSPQGAESCLIYFSIFFTATSWKKTTSLSLWFCSPM